MEKYLVCFGEALGEFNQQDKGSFVFGIGGDVSNCAVAASRAGAKAHMIGALGDDMSGKAIIDFWQQENIQFDNVQMSKIHPTGIYFISHGKNGHEFSYYRKGSAAANLRFTDLNLDVIKNAAYLHLSGISLAISEQACDTCFELVHFAKKHDVKISFDPNLRLKLWNLDRARAITHEMVKYADILLPGLDDALQLCGKENKEEVLDFYENIGAKTIALTMGGDGVMLRHNKETHFISPYKVNAIDATGAGDTFDGNFLAALMAGKSHLEAAHIANAAAALAVQGYGATAPMPYKAATEEMIKK